ncbi:MAG: hypothetical protein R3D03_01555 [Geminicoccaceae bacterium]
MAAWMLKRLTWTGSTLRSRSIADKDIAKEVEARVWPLIEAGRVRPVIYETFALNDASGLTPSWRAVPIQARSCWWSPLTDPCRFMSS